MVDYQFFEGQELETMTNQDALFDRIVRHGASSETLRILLAEYKKNNSPGKALQECLKAVRIYPQDPFLMQMLAESYAEMGFLSQAEMELEKLTAGMGVLIDAYKLQAKIYQKQNRGEEALRSLRIYLAHRPEDGEALEAFETLQPPPPAMEAPASEIKAPAPLKRSEDFREETSEPPQEKTLSEIATSTLAEVYVSQGEIEEALKIYQRVITQNPEDERTRNRVEELNALLSPQPFAFGEAPDRVRRNKERAVAVLETWLSGLRKLYRESVPT
jgi:tetratricopeptide (TPR) repeat protein